MLAALLRRWPIFVATVFTVVLVQMNVGGNCFWICFTGFPVKWELWGDASPLLHTFTSDTAINLGLTLFAVLLLFGMTLPRNGLVWTQHLLTVMVASLFSWFNPWRQTYAADDLGPPGFHFADAGFPYIFRFVTRVESLPFLLLNIWIAVCIMVALFLTLERLISARHRSRPPASWTVLQKWALIVVSVLLFVHANAEAYWTGVPFVYDTPTKNHIWAAVLDVLIGISFVIGPLLFSSTRRRSYVLSFVTLYALANCGNWGTLKEMLGTTDGRGFPFSYLSLQFLEYDFHFLIVDIILGLLLAALIFRLTPSVETTGR